MRWSTEDEASGRTRPAIRDKPSARVRGTYFVLGALIGAVIGYGVATGGPVQRELLDPAVLAWIIGPALVCGSLAALSPRRSLRPGGRFRWYHPGDD